MAHYQARDVETPGALRLDGWRTMSRSMSPTPGLNRAHDDGNGTYPLVFARMCRKFAVVRLVSFGAG